VFHVSCQSHARHSVAGYRKHAFAVIQQRAPSTLRLSLSDTQRRKDENVRTRAANTGGSNFVLFDGLHYTFVEIAMSLRIWMYLYVFI
jgi:hypothetical protein